MKKKLALFLGILMLLNGCYSYKQLNPIEDEFVVGQKYEIRIGNRQKQRVLVKEVNDSTLLVVQEKTELLVQRAMITESKMRKYSAPKTILASAVGVLLTIVTIGALSWSSGSSSKPIFECC